MYSSSGARRGGWRTNRILYLTVLLLVCGGMIFASRAGLLAPVEDVLATPLNIASGFFNRLATGLTRSATDLAEVQQLQRRNAELEEALARYQAELVELREIANDYQRLADLLAYRNRARAQEFLTADVINVDQSGSFRTIVINRGARDGVTVGMPIITQQGLVGRVIQVSSTAARVMLINETTSSVSARLQTSRAEGSISGDPSGNLIMQLIPLNQPVVEGDLVLTSGLGGNFPPDLVIGQVTSVRQSDLGLYQQAQVRSLIDFSTLEFVLVVTNFQPIELSVFQEPVTP